jgi:hypothetical protein
MRGLVLEPRIEAAGEYHSLVGELEIEEDDWDYMQARFAEAGVSGGFSFSAGEFQAHLDGPSGVPSLVLSADAAAYSGEQRLRAGEMLARIAPVEVNRLYQFRHRRGDDHALHRRAHARQPLDELHVRGVQGCAPRTVERTRKGGPPARTFSLNLRTRMGGSSTRSSRARTPKW